MKRRLGVRTICAVALALSAGWAGAEPGAADLFFPRRTAPAATPAPVLSLPKRQWSVPTLLSPKGMSSDDFPAYDDFVHRAIAQKRLELVRFVDKDDRRVFLGLSRDGYFGIQVQTRDRR